MSDGSCKFAGAKHHNLDAVINMLRSEPQSSKSGQGSYVLGKPIEGGEFFDYFAFRDGSLTVAPLGGTQLVAVDKKPSAVAGGNAKVTKAAVKVAEKARKEAEKKAKDEAKHAEKERRRSIKLAKKDKGPKQEVEMPSYPIERIAVTKRDAPTFGMTFIGPDPGGQPTGVYITKVAEGGAAHNAGGVRRGMRILAMNGQPMILATKAEAVSALRSGVTTAIMTLQYIPFQSHD